MEGENAKETLANLYGLRAGLSVVSQEYDKFQEYYAPIRRHDEEVVQTIKNNCSRMERRIKDLENRISDDKTQEGKAREEHSKAQAKAKSWKTKKYQIPLSIFLVIVGLALLLFFVYLLIDFFAGMINYFGWVEGIFENVTFFRVLYGWFEAMEFPWWATLLIIVGWLLSPFLGVGLIIGAKPVSDRKISKNYAEKAEAEESRARELVDDIASSEREISSLRQKLTAERARPELRIEWKAHEQKYAVKNNHVIAGKAVYEALVAEYTSILDPRDWKYLDYIIFVFETRRADSIREALLLCDREMQTERIEQSINRASSEISRTIRCGLNDLRVQMENGFFELTNEIRRSTSRIIAENERTTQAIERNTQATLQLSASNAAYLSSIASSAALNNALTAKSTETSMRLMEDVHKLSVYADSAETRRRSNL